MSSQAPSSETPPTPASAPVTAGAPRVPEAEACPGCGAALGPARRFCRECGAVRPREAASRSHHRAADMGGPAAAGPTCPACGEAVPEGDPPPFCRACGSQLGGARSRSAFPAGDGPAARSGVAVAGTCRSCGHALVAERKFCPACGTATAQARAGDASGLQDPAWREVVGGLTRVWEGTALLVGAAVFAAAVATLLSLFDLDAGDGTLRVALLGAAAVAAVLGLGMTVWGDVLDLRAPRAARGKVHAWVVLALGGAATLCGVLALGRAAAAGFEGGAVPRDAELLGVGGLLFLLGRLIAFATLLRRLAFALRNYRIAQGSVGFIVYVGVGLAVVGLLNLLFRSAPESARTFGELLALAFAAGTALWAIGLAKRSRDLVRQRLA